VAEWYVFQPRVRTPLADIVERVRQAGASGFAGIAFISDDGTHSPTCGLVEHPAHTSIDSRTLRRQPEVTEYRFSR
jgi:hypothetical protein